MRPPRAAILLALLALLLPGVVACGGGVGDERTVTVLGPWLDDPQRPDDESDVFRRVLGAYGEAHDLEIAYQGTRAIGQALGAKVRDGTLPDIAILPNVGELATYATEELAQPVTALVRPGMRVPEGTVAVDHRALWRGPQAYAVAIKTDVKSLLIHRRGDPAPASLAAGQNRGLRWCIGLSEASVPGWPGTDWIEDLLLQNRDVPTYEAMASGELAWTELKDVWTAFAGYLGEPKRTLLSSPAEAADDLAQRRGCDAMHQSSFYARGDTTFVPSGQRLEVSGDFAARFTTHPAADGLLRHLAEGREWTAEGRGLVFPLDPDPEAYQPPRRDVALTLRRSTSRCLDASDAMPPRMAAAFRAAVLRFVADDERLTTLDTLLRDLDQVRTATAGERLTVRCTG